MTEKLTTADVYLAYCGDLFLSENWYKWGCDFHWRIHWVVAVTTGKTSKRTVGILRHLFQRKFLSQQRIRKYYLIRIDRKIYHCVILGIPHKSPTLRDKNYDEGNRVKREPLLRVWYWTLRPFYKVCKPLLNKPTFSSLAASADQGGIIKSALNTAFFYSKPLNYLRKKSVYRTGDLKVKFGTPHWKQQSISITANSFHQYIALSTIYIFFFLQ